MSTHRKPIKHTRNVCRHETRWHIRSKIMFSFQAIIKLSLGSWGHFVCTCSLRSQSGGTSTVICYNIPDHI